MSMEVRVVAGRFGLTDDDETSVRGVEHFDRGAVERGEGLASKHHCRSADHNTSTGEIDDPIQIEKDRVHVVGDDDDRDTLVATDSLQQTGDRRLVRKVKAVEGLVEQ